MARPTNFREANAIFKGDHIPNCVDLPVYRDNTQSISRWVLSEEEKAAIALTGIVWLGVSGQDHPPVWISGVYPFTVSETEKE